MQVQELTQMLEFLLLILGVLIFTFTIINVSLIFLVIGIFKELNKGGDRVC